MDRGINLLVVKKLLLISFPLFFAFPISIHAGKCGTPLQFSQSKNLPQKTFKTSALGMRVLTSADDLRCRTLETDHFLIHYSLRGIHRVRLDDEDKPLMKTVDSLYAVFSNKAFSSTRLDSAVYATLDLLKAPQPKYVLKTQEYFEAARHYYVDILGMLAPQASISSAQYKLTKNYPKKFPVDLINLSSFTGFFGPYYGITNRPDELSITFENDFLWNTKLDSNGNSIGTGIKSEIPEKVFHDYSIDWEMGIKVTAYHEFYHAIQFTYNPNPPRYHAWYELSATGMEERNAPEVNDYFQYLPCILKNPSIISLTGLFPGPCTHEPMYGNVIFHVFLTERLDSIFDVKVWKSLSKNGDNLRLGLENTFAAYGKDMQSLYADYTTQLTFSGLPFNPFTKPFSSDTPLWTTLAIDTLDLSDATPFRKISIAPLTFIALKISWNSTSLLKSMRLNGFNSIQKIFSNSDTTIIENLNALEIPLLLPPTGFDNYLLVLANSSFSDQASAEIKTVESRFYAFPNPIHTQGKDPLLFFPSKEMTFPTFVEIYSENGVLVRTINFPDQNASLLWDMKDEKNIKVKPGIYYYRLEKETFRPLVLLR